MEDSHTAPAGRIIFARVMEKRGLLHSHVPTARLNHAPVNGKPVPPILPGQLREDRIETRAQHPPRLFHLRIRHPAKYRIEELARPVHPPRFHDK